jgi:hypothetical protein
MAVEKTFYCSVDELKELIAEGETEIRFELHAQSFEYEGATIEANIWTLAAGKKIVIPCPRPCPPTKPPTKPPGQIFDDLKGKFDSGKES